MMQDLMKSLPDGRPITSVCIVEDQGNCPEGFQVVDRTFDQDIDADLWKDGFWGKRITRYICLSKDLQTSDEIVEDLLVIGEKDPIPDGFILLAYTKDTEQRAMRKRQLCMKVSKRESAQQAVTDIIVLSKSRRPPPDFLLAGEINNLLLCFKMTMLTPEKRAQIHPNESAAISGESTTHREWPTTAYLANSLHNNTQPPTSVLDGVPFEINSKYKTLFCLSVFVVPAIQLKAAEEIESQYSYDFSLEYQAQEAVQNCDGGDSGG